MRRLHLEPSRPRNSSLAPVTTVGHVTIIGPYVAELFPAAGLAHIGLTLGPPLAPGYSSPHHLGSMVAWGEPHRGGFLRRALSSLVRRGFCISSPHRLCMSYVDPFRRELFFSISGATQRIPAGPQRALVLKLVDIALNWTPLDERVLLWTGFPNKMQRATTVNLTLVTSMPAWILFMNRMKLLCWAC